MNAPAVELDGLSSSEGLHLLGGGRAAASAGDINADGYDDLLFGGVDQAFLLYGGRTGTESTEPVFGSGTRRRTIKEILRQGVRPPVIDVFTGNAGNDAFDTIHHDDIVYAGAGDDVVTIGYQDAGPIDGGLGRDTLRYHPYVNRRAYQLLPPGAFRQVLSLLTADTSAGEINTRFKRFEILEKGGTADVLFEIDKQSVLQLSDDTQDGITTLTIRADFNDIIRLFDQGWQRGGWVSDSTGTYIEYLNGNARVLVSEGTRVKIEA